MKDEKDFKLYEEALRLDYECYGCLEKNAVWFCGKDIITGICPTCYNQYSDIDVDGAVCGIQPSYKDLLAETLSLDYEYTSGHTVYTMKEFETYAMDDATQYVSAKNRYKALKPYWDNVIEEMLLSGLSTCQIYDLVADKEQRKIEREQKGKNAYQYLDISLRQLYKITNQIKKDLNMEIEIKRGRKRIDIYNDVKELRLKGMSMAQIKEELDERGKKVSLRTIGNRIKEVEEELNITTKFISRKGDG